MVLQSSIWNTFGKILLKHFINKRLNWWFWAKQYYQPHCKYFCQYSFNTFVLILDPQFRWRIRVTLHQFERQCLKVQPLIHDVPKLDDNHLPTNNRVKLNSTVSSFQRLGAMYDAIVSPFLTKLIGCLCTISDRTWDVIFHCLKLTVCQRAGSYMWKKLEKYRNVSHSINNPFLPSFRPIRSFLLNLY